MALLMFPLKFSAWIENRNTYIYSFKKVALNIEFYLRLSLSFLGKSSEASSSKTSSSSNTSTSISTGGSNLPPEVISQLLATGHLVREDGNINLIYTILRWVMKFLTGGYEISLILGLKWFSSYFVCFLIRPNFRRAHSMSINKTQQFPLSSFTFL